MLANRAGVFNAYPQNIGVDQTGDNKLWTVLIAYAIVQELHGEEATDVSSQGMTITGYHYIQKKDSQPNEMMLKSLRAAFPDWNGQDAFWLQDNAEALGQKPVQIVLGEDEYQGKKKIKVQWLNAFGAEPQAGGVSKGGADKRAAFANSMGPAMRALFGGQPAPAAAPKKPAMPPPASKPPTLAAAMTAPKAAPDPLDYQPCTMDEAWTKFNAALPDNIKASPDFVAKEWQRILGDMFPQATALTDLTGQDWGRMAAEGPGKVLPF